MSALTNRVFNRGSAPAWFLQELVAVVRSLPDTIFDRTPTVGNKDIYNKVFSDLGPYTDITHRRAVMCEVLRVLGGFESSWKKTEGVDVSRRSATTSDNAEAGIFQTSYDARHLDAGLRQYLITKGVDSGNEFQTRMKTDFPFAVEFNCRLLRVNTKHNGPLYRGDERKATWPNRPKLWAAEESIYPWLSKDAVSEFQALLA